MKTRTRFVSNSSTSSFVLFGAELTRKELDKIDEDNPFDKVYDLGFQIEELEDCDTFILGVTHPFDKMFDDETKREFHLRIWERLTEKFPQLHIRLKDVGFYSGTCVC